MINYNGLFSILDKRNLKKTDLLKVISNATLAKLSKGDIIRSDTIDKICDFLEVQPGDIMQYRKIRVTTLTEKSQDQLYKAGYKQKIEITIPEDINHFINEYPPECITLYSKLVHENTNEIENGIIDIPNDFIESSIIFQKDPYFKKLFKE